jgi:hypothetical protein
MEHQHPDHAKPSLDGHSKHSTHTMPDGTVMEGTMQGAGHSGHGGGQTIQS